MNDYPEIKLLPKIRVGLAKDLNDAFKKGFFSGSITRWELEDRLFKFNDTMRIHSSATHRGLFDRTRFICGIGHNITIPKFTIAKYDPALHHKINYTNEWGEKTGSEIVNRDDYDGYIFARGWPEILKDIMRKGYYVNTKGLL